MNSFNTCFWDSCKLVYLVLNFSNKILYVKILKSLSYYLNSSITSSLTLDSTSNTKAAYVSGVYSAAQAGYAGNFYVTGLSSTGSTSQLILSAEL